MRTIRPTIAMIALIVLVLATVAACAGGSSPQFLSTVGSAVGQPASDENGSGGDQAAASSAPALPVDGVGALVDDAKIIRTGTIELQVTDVPTALTTARDGIRALGGYIGASQTENRDDEPVAIVTYRVPADRWEQALDLLRGLNGQTRKIINERTEAVEVTGAVLDLEARIRNLRASETALQQIAARATKVSDVLEVQAQLTTVRGQIEQLTAQLTELQDRAAFATLTASFSVPVVAVQVATKGWEPSVVVDEATASLVDILQALTTAGIWFAIVWLPLLLALGIMALVVGVVVRRLGFLGRRRSEDSPAVG